MMNDDIANNATKLWELGEKLKEDDELRLQINNDPLGFLKSIGIEVEDNFSDSVSRGLKSITVGKGAPPDSTQASLLAMIEAKELPKSQAPMPPSNLKVVVEKASADIAVQDFQFRVNGWGLVLVVPEYRIKEVADGGTTVATLGKALMAALSAAAGVAKACPPLAALFAIGGLWCGIQAAWIVAELLVILAVDSKHHKGVYLTWTWVGLALTAYLPIPTAIT